jgi:hypothetical protein
VRKIAIAALPIAISSALQMSGFGGAPIALAAWGVVVLVCLTLLLDFLLKRRRASSEEDLGHMTTTFGRELVSFIHQRNATCPSQPNDQQGLGRIFGAMRGDHVRRRRFQQSYDADTMALYQEHFADLVLTHMHRLRAAGRLGAGEVERLIPPTTPAAIYDLGRRLIELGYSSSGSDGTRTRDLRRDRPAL